MALVRHGERADKVGWLRNNNITNKYDPPLTEKGIIQAKETG